MKVVSKVKWLVLIAAFSVLFNQQAFAQLEVGGLVHFRGMNPSFGYGGFGELGIPTEGSWRLAFRGYIAVFGSGVPDYRVIYHGPGSKFGQIDSSKTFTGTPMTGFDRGIGFRIYFQETEFQPFFGIGATYAYNDILNPGDTPENDIIERSLNYDFTIGASYILSENIVTYAELHFANITRANLVLYESFVGLNIGFSYRFGNNKFSNVYEMD